MYVMTRAVLEHEKSSMGRDSRSQREAGRARRHFKVPRAVLTRKL
jgi:hypothetical protein